MAGKHRPESIASSAIAKAVTLTTNECIDAANAAVAALRDAGMLAERDGSSSTPPDTAQSDSDNPCSPVCTCGDRLWPDSARGD